MAKKKEKKIEEAKNLDATIFDVPLVDPRGNELKAPGEDGKMQPIKLGDLLIAILNMSKTDGKSFSEMAVLYTLTSKIANHDENLKRKELEMLIDAIKDTPDTALTWNTKFAVLRALSERYEYVARKLEEAVENEE